MTAMRPRPSAEPLAAKVPRDHGAVLGHQDSSPRPWGESTSDYLVTPSARSLAVAVGTLVLLGVRGRSRSPGRYIPLGLLVGRASLVAIVGTMAADVLHKQFGVPYARLVGLLRASSWPSSSWPGTGVEGTLSIHSIDTPRRELFYWVAVMATFAMGTALGDFTATDPRPRLPRLGGPLRRRCILDARRSATAGSGMNEVVAFWCGLRPDPAARGVHRRLAGQADATRSGLGLGDGPVSAGLRRGSSWSAWPLMTRTWRRTPAATAPDRGPASSRGDRRPPSGRAVSRRVSVRAVGPRPATTGTAR